jgi:3-oxoacyl-[acyl-carrier protein] reductase
MTGYTLSDYPQESKELMLKINLEAPIALIAKYIDHMQSQSFGRIINITSTAGYSGHPDIWYGITKAGLINLTSGLSKLYKSSGVTINAIVPGPVDTKMMKSVPEERKIFLREKISVAGPLVKSEEIAKAALWLAAEETGYINGLCLEIDNGVIWK